MMYLVIFENWKGVFKCAKYEDYKDAGRVMGALDEAGLWGTCIAYKNGVVMQRTARAAQGSAGPRERKGAEVIEFKRK